MATIKAPFNFVPLSEKVFFPDWADEISHDVPFEDGVSGRIDLKITAMTPIFVRNGQVEGQESNDFCNINGRYYIPATSVKGEVRTLLEIMSFGKMRVDENAKFAQREWDNPDLYPIKDPKLQKTICCGWLFEEDGEYFINKSASSPFRINHRRLNEHFKTNVFKEYFWDDQSKNKHEKSDDDFDLNKAWIIDGQEFDPKTAVFKYKLLESNGIGEDKLCHLKFTTDNEYAVKFQENRLMVNPNGGITGQIVLTGQSSLWKRDKNRQKNDGKFYEFVFDEDIEETIPLSKDEFNHYKFIYKESADFQYLKQYLHTTGVPVFFRMKSKKILDFGFALLYKLPYQHTPAELEAMRKGYNCKNRETDMDMAECIFGKIGAKSLKGRVNFSNFFAKDNAQVDKNYTLILNSPKASYYPIYIEQNGQNGCTSSYKTYNDGKLSGWKRYVVRKHVWEKRMNNPELDSVLYPLKAETEFTGSIHYHNLKPQELGALISAITFFGDNDCYHQLGQAKPYGFGKSKYEITKLDAITNDGIRNEEYSQSKFWMCAFEQLLRDNGINFISNNSIMELFTLAHEEVDANDLFEYMVMSVDDKEANEFATAKMSFEFLQKYSELQRKIYQPKSLIKERDTLLEQTRQENERKEREERELQMILAAQQAQAEQEQRKADRLAAGLSFLLEKKVGNDELKITELSNGVGRINQFLKKNADYSISDSDKKAVADWLKLIPKPTKKSDKREFEDFSSKSWNGIIKLFGDDTAKQWFEKIVR